ncbi:MAG: Card1-like endonuclease domain-containing protein [Stellaceae bacterium]
MTNLETASWPDRFIYICSATQAAIVNSLPLIQAGLSRIAEIIVLCGAADPQTRDPRLRREAIEPAEQMERIVREWSRGKPPPVRCLYGDAGRIGAWLSETRRFLDENGRNSRLPVIYNITGGTKQMLLGTLYGCLDEGSGTEKRLIQVTGAPLRTEFVALDTGTEVPAERLGELSLDQYLALYGVAEADAGNRRQNEKFFDINSDVINRFASTVLPQAPILAPVFAKAMEALFPDPRNFTRGVIDPWAVKNSQWALSNATAALLHLDGVGGLSKTKRTDGKTVMTASRRDGAWLVRSQWLEAVLYNRIRKSVATLPYVSVAATVALQLRPGTATDHIGEIDVAVMIRSQLHVIEAKFASFGRRARESAEQSLAQLESLKRQMLGQFGRIIVVNPRETNASLAHAPGAFYDRARRAGIDLMLGPSAVDDAVELIRQLAA